MNSQSADELKADAAYQSSYYELVDYLIAQQAVGMRISSILERCIRIANSAATRLPGDDIIYYFYEAYGWSKLLRAVARSIEQSEANH